MVLLRYFKSVIALNGPGPEKGARSRELSLDALALVSSSKKALKSCFDLMAGILPITLKKSSI